MEISIESTYLHVNTQYIQRIINTAHQYAKIALWRQACDWIPKSTAPYLYGPASVHT